MTQNLVSHPSPETVTQSPLLEWVKLSQLVCWRVGVQWYTFVLLSWGVIILAALGLDILLVWPGCRASAQLCASAAATSYRAKGVKL